MGTVTVGTVTVGSVTVETVTMGNVTVGTVTASRKMSSGNCQSGTTLQTPITNFLRCSFCVCSNMAASENLAKRVEELFKTLSAKDSENPKLFLDKKRRDIENLAKELAEDIGDIITVLEMCHKACLAAQIAGNIAVTSGKGKVIGH